MSTRVRKTRGTQAALVVRTGQEAETSNDGGSEPVLLAEADAVTSKPIPAGAGDVDDDNTNSTSDNKSQNGSVPGATEPAVAEVGRLRQRKPVQYMPSTRSTKAPKALLTQRSETAYLADIPALLTGMENVPGLAAECQKEDILVDHSRSEIEMKLYLRRCLAKVIMSRSDPPPVNVVSLGESSSDSSDEEAGGVSSGDDHDTTGTAGDKGTKRRRIMLRNQEKRTLRTRSRAFLDEPPEPVCGENSGIMFVDGALVLLHPNIHEKFLEILKLSNGDFVRALNELDSSLMDLVVIWTMREQEYFNSSYAKFGDNMELIYREVAHRFVNKTFKNMVDYFYRCVYAAKEMETLLPEIKHKTMQRTLSQRNMTADSVEDVKSASSGQAKGQDPAENPPLRESRMSTRGKSITPSWQRSDIYELETNLPAISDSDEEGGQNDTTENESTLRALQFIKRGRVLLDPFNFSQLLNALLLFDKKLINAAELVVRVRNICKVSDDSTLIVSSPGLTLFREFLLFFPENMKKHLVESTMASVAASIPAAVSSVSLPGVADVASGTVYSLA